MRIINLKTQWNINFFYLFLIFHFFNSVLRNISVITIIEIFLLFFFPSLLPFLLPQDFFSKNLFTLRIQFCLEEFIYIFFFFLQRVINFQHFFNLKFFSINKVIFKKKKRINFRIDFSCINLLFPTHWQNFMKNKNQIPSRAIVHIYIYR